MTFSKNDIKIGPGVESTRIVNTMRQIVGGEMRKRGGVIGISGGIDSSVCRP